MSELRHEAEESMVPSHRVLLLCLWMLFKLRRRGATDWEHLPKDEE